jgi:hypothetical protein
MVRYYANQICDAVYQRNGLEYRWGKNKKMSTKYLALTLLGCILGPLYKEIIYYISVSFRDSVGYMYMACYLI